jgi:hypothetical protein
MSYNEFAHAFFEDDELLLIEKVAKILDYFKREKIVRIILLLLDNLKDIKGCQDYLSDVDAFTIILKL